MQVRNSIHPILNTDNLPLNIEPIALSCFNTYLKACNIVFGPKLQYELAICDARVTNMAIHLNLLRVAHNVYQIANVYLSNYVDGQLIESGLEAGYAPDTEKWSSSVAVIKRHRSADAFVRFVLEVFNQEAREFIHARDIESGSEEYLAVMMRSNKCDVHSHA